FTPANGASGLNYANFTFQVQDDGGTANGGVDLDPTANTITFNVGVESPPVINNLSGDTVGFTAGGATPVHLHAGTASTVTDSDSSDFYRGNVTVAITSKKAAGEDVLGLDTAAAPTVTLSAGLTVGSHVSVGGTDIGTIANNGDGAGGNNLVVTFNANATPA